MSRKVIWMELNGTPIRVGYYSEEGGPEIDSVFTEDGEEITQVLREEELRELEGIIVEYYQDQGESQ